MSETKVDPRDVRIALESLYEAAYHATLLNVGLEPIREAVDAGITAAVNEKGRQ